jgi:hypothetical protein
MANRLAQRIWARLLQWLQRRCRHGGGWVLADATEGAMPHGAQVRWCRACGAIAIVCCHGDQPLLRMPEPVWMAEPDGRGVFGSVRAPVAGSENAVSTHTVTPLPLGREKETR